MRKVISKYIDSKKLVTGLVQAAIIGVFLLVWNNISQITKFLWPALTYEIKIPLVPSILVLIITQLIIQKGLLKFQIKFGKKKSFSVNQWIAKTNKNAPQWVDYKEISLNNGLLTSIKCKIRFQTNYLRFGFKLLEKNARDIGDIGILHNDNNGLFHIAKAINDNKIYTTCYKNGIQDGTDIYSGEYSAESPVTLEVKIGNNNNLEFHVNERKSYQTIIKSEYRERLLLMAWGDGNEYKVEVNDIEVKTKE